MYLFGQQTSLACGREEQRVFLVFIISFINLLSKLSHIWNTCAKYASKIGVRKSHAADTSLVKIEF
jgi:hypothetical protein